MSTEQEKQAKRGWPASPEEKWDLMGPGWVDQNSDPDLGFLDHVIVSSLAVNISRVVSIFDKLGLGKVIHASKKQ